MKTYTCESCGAKMLLNDQLSHVTSCLYCGNTIVVRNEQIDNLNIKYMIPFSIDKEEAMTKIRKLTRNTPVEAKKVYVPVRFSSFDYDYLYYFEYVVEHTDEDGHTSYSYHDAEELLDGRAEREIVFGTSKVSNIYMDYEYRKQPVVEYNPTLVQDVTIEISDFSQINLPQQQEQRLKEYAARCFSKYDICKVYSENYFISNSTIDSFTTLVPVYVVRTARNIVYNVPGIKTPKPPISFGFLPSLLLCLLGVILISVLAITFDELVGPVFLALVITFVVFVKAKQNNHSFDGFQNNTFHFSSKRKKLK